MQQLLLEIADYLDPIVNRTLAALNDEAEFIARDIIRFFGGWWSGRPSELELVQRKALATA